MMVRFNRMLDLPIPRFLIDHRLSISLPESRSSYTSDNLTAVAVGSDLDGNSLTFEYVWSVAGSPVQAGSSNTLTSSLFIKDETVSVSVQAFDQTDFSTAEVASILISNASPTAPTISSRHQYPSKEMMTSFVRLLEHQAILMEILSHMDFLGLLMELPTQMPQQILPPLQFLLPKRYLERSGFVQLHPMMEVMMGQQRALLFRLIPTGQECLNLRIVIRTTCLVQAKDNVIRATLAPLWKDSSP